MLTGKNTNLEIEKIKNAIKEADYYIFEKQQCLRACSKELINLNLKEIAGIKGLCIFNLKNKEPTKAFIPTLRNFIKNDMVEIELNREQLKELTDKGEIKIDNEKIKVVGNKKGFCIIKYKGFIYFLAKIEGTRLIIWW